VLSILWYASFPCSVSGAPFNMPCGDKAGAAGA
jgi:hypothetical protein